jgi:hypothetical protein
MNKHPLAPLHRLAADVLASVLMAGSGHSVAQNAAAPPGRPGAQAQTATKPSANDAMLARAGKLYYSSTKAGLVGFDCKVRPDWPALFRSAQPDTPLAENDSRMVLLNSVKIVLHARMKGNSTVEWVAPSAPDKNSAELLENMHAATEQTMQGFLQFWTPFVDGSAIPSSSDGLDITTSDKGYKLHAKTSDTEVTEELDNQLTLTHFNVVMSQATVSFSPTYKATPRGFLVNGFLAHILPAGAPPEKTQEMHVDIEYQTIGDIPIPARMNMKVIDSGEFDFTLEGCTVNRE